ncbi:MAG: hypothetical protein K9N07_05900 [Candidatus Cloacimonetes bacterium]|nr:hypothetical protein [Candidatus Cloacimonadota bacterium]
MKKNKIFKLLGIFLVSAFFIAVLSLIFYKFFPMQIDGNDIIQDTT